MFQFSCWNWHTKSAKAYACGLRPSLGRKGCCFKCDSALIDRIWSGCTVAEARISCLQPCGNKVVPIHSTRKRGYQRRQFSAQDVTVSWAYHEGGSGNRKLEGTWHECKLLAASTWDTHSHHSHGSQRGKTVTLSIMLYPERQEKGC